MILIDGKKAAAELREELKQEVAELKNKYNKKYYNSLSKFTINTNVIATRNNDQIY